MCDATAPLKPQTPQGLLVKFQAEGDEGPISGITAFFKVAVFKTHHIIAERDIAVFKRRDPDARSSAIGNGIEIRAYARSRLSADVNGVGKIELDVRPDHIAPAFDIIVTKFIENIAASPKEAIFSGFGKDAVIRVNRRIIDA